MKKSLWLIVFTVVMILGLSGVAAAAPLNITLDGHTLHPEVSPQVVNGRTLVPVRVVSEALAANVNYVSQSVDKPGVVITSASGKEVDLRLGDKTARIREDDELRQVRLDAAPRIQNGRMLVPLRLVAEFFDAKVDYKLKGGVKTVDLDTEPVVWQGQELRCVQLTTHMTMEDFRSAYYGDANVAYCYGLLRQALKNEVEPPAEFNRWPNLDAPYSYYSSFTIGFYNTQAETKEGAVMEYTVYRYMSETQAKPPEQYSEILLHDMIGDKWYRADADLVEKIYDFGNNRSLCKSI